MKNYFIVYLFTDSMCENKPISFLKDVIFYKVDSLLDFVYDNSIFENSNATRCRIYRLDYVKNKLVYVLDRYKNEPPL